MLTPKIIVHLGASKVPQQFQAESIEWCRKAVQAGFLVAQKGGKAEDIVTESVSILENSPVSDAGFGSVFHAKGGIQMDAGIMTGDKKYGAVLSIHNVQNPIKAARILLDDPKFSILCGKGAMEFIKSQNIPLCPDSSFITKFNTYVQEHFQDLNRRIQENSNNEFDHGTVGCVALDSFGNIAAGTSTGGTYGAPFGRVADSSIPGCGVWADDSEGACSCTGYGERILVENLASKASARLTIMSSMDAAKESIKAFAKTPKSLGGIIIISKKTGEYGFFHNTPHMPCAYLNNDGSITSLLSMNDLLK